MLVERIENRWLAAFTRTFTLCKVQPGEVVAILAETQSRRVNVDLARLALEAMGARVFEVTLTTPALTAPAPVRSTGANEVAGRHTLGHFDLPLRGCTIRLDDTVVVVDAGQVVSAALA